MGFLGTINEFYRSNRNDVNVSNVNIDTGGGANHTAEHFGAPGDDSYPLTSDYVAAMETQETGGLAVVGYLDPINEAEALEGEKILYSRDPNTGAKIGWVHIKNDGSIRIENANGYIELTATGLLDINGQEFTAHTHDPGTYAAGGDNVTGVSGGVS